MKVNPLQEREVELHDLATKLVSKRSPSFWCDVLLVADAPVDVLRPRHRAWPTPLSGPVWSRALGTLWLAWA
jgi:hypothetical protein